MPERLGQTPKSGECKEGMNGRSSEMGMVLVHFGRRRKLDSRFHLDSGARQEGGGAEGRLRCRGLRTADGRAVTSPSDAMIFGIPDWYEILCTSRDGRAGIQAGRQVAQPGRPPPP